LIFLLIVAFINQRHVFRIIAFIKANKPYEAYMEMDLTRFWITAVVAAGHLVLRRGWKNATLPFWLSLAKGKDDTTERQKHAQKATDNSFQLIWFTFAVAYGFSVIKGSKCHHHWIGGNQTDYEGLYVGLPFHDNPEIFMYCLINHGYHFA
jgi:hypothetical protein